MPACLDCGLGFDSVYNLQLHRRSGACSVQSLGARAAVSAPQSMVYAAGYPVMPAADPMRYASNVGFGGYDSGKGCYDMQGAPVLPTATVPGPYVSPVEREIEQVLAIQRNRQAADMAERERLMLDQQVNLVLPARQAQLQQTQQALKDQLLQLKLQLLTSQQQQQSGNNMDISFLRNEMAAMRGALSSISVSGTSASDPGPTLRKPHKLQQQPAPATRVQGRPVRDHHESDSDEDDSWESLDDVLQSDKNDGNSRGTGSRDRSRNRFSPRNTSLFGSTPLHKVRNVLRNMQAEIRSLRTMNATRMEPAFPTVSTLESGLHSLKLATLEGIDLAVPLDEVDVSIKTYYMSYANNEYLLEPSVERRFPRRPPPLARRGAHTLLFMVPSLEFIVHSPKEMVVFALRVFYRSRLLCWAVIFAKAAGSFSEGVRHTLFDLAKALQSPGDMIPGARVSGCIEADPSDILQRAESILNPSAGNFGVSPGLPSSWRQHVQLPGLPPLPPPPHQLPLLPGMPGCEGPFLPPTLDGTSMILQPTKGPTAHFILPPPTGLSILEWNQQVIKHIKRMQRHSPHRDTAPTAEMSMPHSRRNRNGTRGSHCLPARPPRRRQMVSDSSSSKSRSSSSASSKDSVRSSSSPSPPPSSLPSFSIGSIVSGSPHRGHGAGEIVKETSRHPPDKRQQQKQPRRDHRVATHFAEASSKVMSLAEMHVAQSSAMSSQESPQPDKGAAVVALAQRLDSPAAPPRQAHTPPPSGEALLSHPAVKKAPAEELPDKPEPPMAVPLPPSTPSEDGKSVLNAAVAPPPAPYKVPREDIPLVERSRLRPLTDPQGNLAVPPDYKLKPNNPPCVNLDMLDVTAHPPVNPCVLLGLSKPTDAPPPAPKAPGHGEKGSTVNLFVDGVVGVPFDAVCSRVLVYVTDELDPQTGAPVNPLRHPRVFMRKPDLVAYQSLTSSSIEPEFQVKMSSDVGDRTHAVVVVEYVNGREGPPIVFGHCCLPINKRFFAGNFVARVKLGDPRRSQERAVDEMRPSDRIFDEQKRATERYDQAQLEASIDAQALRNLMPAPPRKRAECVPLGYLIWRLESSDMSSPFFEMPQQLPLSQREVQLFADRKNHADVTPSSKGLASEKAADEAFIGAGTTQTDSVSYIAPFSEQRGAFVKVEGIRGVGDDAAMYVVVVYMAKAPKGRRVCYTVMPDWNSDVGAPIFKDPPFVFGGIQYDRVNTTTYMLLKLSALENAATPPVVESIGWTMNKLFMDEAPALRQGRYTLPWLNGPLPLAVVQELLTQPVGTVFLNRMKEKTIAFREPKATLTISQGDPACCVALVDEAPGRAQPRQLLMPAAIKKTFPSYTCEGMVGCTLRRANEKCFGSTDPRALLQRINTAVQQYLHVSMKAFEEL
ncbi:hypothetical protein GH5_05148 [Leishmania sp. Ghana 2012 LV757]|uniref:hypothetical protein n=1 Tax=Leishmania sp. Ghana 2012 LV757 TaxID=2803181 RepID=UPI001B48F8F0|nr:hypothetical protein GH5_05148 [Leishmania sp. Ghana 2012 LV757]